MEMKCKYCERETVQTDQLCQVCIDKINDLDDDEDDEIDDDEDEEDEDLDDDFEDDESMEDELHAAQCLIHSLLHQLEKAYPNPHPSSEVALLIRQARNE